MADDEMHRRKITTLNPVERYPYKGNRSPSKEAFAKAGYATLSMADPDATYGNTVEDREPMSPDIEYDRRLIRR